VAYGDIYTQGTYYLSSVADKVYLNPQGEIDWHGIGAQPMFVKDLLAKFGVRMQVLKVGKYKSATEMFTEEKMSDFNRHQMQVYIDGLWQNICQEVAASRKLTVKDLNDYADSLITFSTQQDLVAKKMADGLLYHDQIKGEVKKLLKLKEKDDINQVSVTDMQNVKENADGDEIAIYYAYGDIVDDPTTGMLQGGGHQIVSGDVCKDLEKLMNDDDVKAVVIRVNSPGGSAYASEQIWRQVSLLKEKKPVVISMGGYAASGGYYISCNANWIVAEPTTLTGSIGIFGMIPDLSQLVTQKLGVKFDEVKTNKYSTFGNNMARPMSAEETAFMQRYIERGYATFRQRVSDGRKLTIEQVEENAQGHVFLGQDALKLKLVDELGGLDQAVAKAATLAKIDEYHTSPYPAKASIMEQLLKNMEQESNTYLDTRMRAMLGEYYEPFYLMMTMNKQAAVQARLPFWLNIR
jgi:protease-4